MFYIFLLDYVDISFWNIHPLIVSHFSSFCFFQENTTLIFYCIILSKRPWSIIIFTSFEAVDKEEWNVPTIYLFLSTFYVSSAFSPCVFRIKIRFCQFSLQGKIKKKNGIVRVQKCFLIYSPYFVYKDKIRI